MKTGFVLAISMVAFFVFGSQAPAAEIVGQVVDTTGRPVSGVQIVVEDASGQSVGQVVSDSTGEYRLSGLGEGTYSLSANGQSAVTYVGHEGVTVDWGISGSSSLATARPGLAAPESGAGNNAPELPLAGSQTLAPVSASSNGVNCMLTPDAPSCKVCTGNSNPKKCNQSPAK